MSLLTSCVFLVDIIGICKSYEDATKITVKSNNREVAKRDIHLMDMSGKVVTATLWGEDVSTCMGQSTHMARTAWGLDSGHGGEGPCCLALNLKSFHVYCLQESNLIFTLLCFLSRSCDMSVLYRVHLH